MAVVNIRDSDYDVYIGRGMGRGVDYRNKSWGNPFKVGVDGNLTQVILMYENHLINELLSGKKTQDDLRALHGKTLGCYCKPNPCHGDVIDKFIDLAVRLDPMEFEIRLKVLESWMPGLYAMQGIEMEV